MDLIGEIKSTVWCGCVRTGSVTDGLTGLVSERMGSTLAEYYNCKGVRSDPDMRI